MSADDQIETSDEANGTRSPEEIRASIAETREELGDTVEALAAKTDVKSRATHKVDELKASVQEQKERVTEKAHAAAPSSASEGGNALFEKAKANPIPVAIASALIGGFAFGRLTSRRRTS